ncbi:hypothetical protein [Mesorhizobium sp. M0408]
MAITPHLERACLKGKLHRKKLVLTSPFFSESKVAGALKGLNVGLPPELS